MKMKNCEIVIGALAFIVALTPAGWQLMHFPKISHPVPLYLLLDGWWNPHFTRDMGESMSYQYDKWYMGRRFYSTRDLMGRDI